MTLQFERSTRFNARGLCATCPSVFFSGFDRIRLAELQIDPQLEYTIRPKARGLPSIWNEILRITFSIWFFIKDIASTIEDLKEKHSRMLGDY
jgi:hypothetical protein